MLCVYVFTGEQVTTGYNHDMKSLPTGTHEIIISSNANKGKELHTHYSHKDIPINPLKRE